MATHALELTDHLVEPLSARPHLRLVETVSVPEPKRVPPAWMIAPTFRPELAPALVFAVREEQAPYHAKPALAAEGPYQSVHQVPRRG